MFDTLKEIARNGWILIENRKVVDCTWKIRLYFFNWIWIFEKFLKSIFALLSFLDHSFHVNLQPPRYFSDFPLLWLQIQIISMEIVNLCLRNSICFSLCSNSISVLSETVVSADKINICNFRRRLNHFCSANQMNFPILRHNIIILWKLFQEKFSFISLSANREIRNEKKLVVWSSARCGIFPTRIWQVSKSHDFIPIIIKGEREIFPVREFDRTKIQNFVTRN